MAKYLDYKHVTRSESQSQPAGKAKWVLFFLSGIFFGATAMGVATVAYFSYFPSSRSSAPDVACEVQPSVVQSTDGSRVDSYPYDFFNILEKDIVFPEPEDKEVGFVYILQAGSFRTLHRAEILQQQIKEIGFDSNVIIRGKDDDVWHVVTIGPDDNLSRINNLRHKLRVAGMNPSILKQSKDRYQDQP